MTIAGVRTINIPRTPVSDDVMVHRDGSTALQSTADLATQLMGQGPLPAAIAGIEVSVAAVAGQLQQAVSSTTASLAAVQDDLTAAVATLEGEIAAAADGNVMASTWAELAAIAGARAGQPGVVGGDDAGTHTDPVIGGSVVNEGLYRWSTSPAGWQRVGDYYSSSDIQLAGAADKRVNTLNVATGSATAYAAARVPAALTTYASLQLFSFVPHLVSGTAPTLAVDGLAALTIKDAAGNDLLPGDLVPYRAYLLQAYRYGFPDHHLRVIAGRLGASADRLVNLFPNGALDPAGAPAEWYGDIVPGQFYRADVTEAGAALSAFGIRRQLNLPAEAAPSLNQGNLLCCRPYVAGGAVLCMVAVHKVSGSWPTDVPTGFVRYSDGSSDGTTMTAYDEVATDVRLHYGAINLDAGKLVTRVDIGLQIVPPRTAVLALGGWWASHLPRGGTGRPSDTCWPSWSAAASNVRADLGARIAAVEKVSTLSALAQLLADDLVSPSICFVGDSNTWGGAASNKSPMDIHVHSLGDDRNTVDVVSPSFVNLFRDWSARSYVPGVLQAGDPGVGYHRNPVLLDPVDDDRFVLMYSSSLVPIAKSPSAAAGATFDRYLQLLSGGLTTLEFWVTGDEIDVVYARNSATADLSLSVQIDDDAPTVYAIGLDGGVAYKQELAISMPFGRHRIRLSAPGTQGVRVEAIRHNRRLLVRNQGIWGTNSTEWLPSGSLYPGIDAQDQVVIIMIGTNDNQGTWQAARTRSNLIQICNALLASGRLPILMTPPPEYGAGQPYSTTLTAQAIASAGKAVGVSVIDNMRAFQVLSDATLQAGYINADLVHLDDAGHQAVFRNIVHAVSGTLPVG